MSDAQKAMFGSANGHPVTATFRLVYKYKNSNEVQTFEFDFVDTYMDIYLNQNLYMYVTVTGLDIENIETITVTPVLKSAGGQVELVGKTIDTAAVLCEFDWTIRNGGNYCMKKDVRSTRMEVVVFDVEEALSTSGAGETLVLVASAATSNTLLRCFISDLITNVPAAGGLASRCAAYRVETDEPAQIVIDESKYRPELYEDVTPEMIVYLESGWQFYTQLLKFNGLMLHASAVAMDGNAYLFSGPCGRGKSTHTRACGTPRSAKRPASSMTTSPRFGAWIPAGSPTARRGAARTASIKTKMAACGHLLPQKRNTTASGS